MSQDPDLDRWEITTAAIGLRGAYKRCMDAYRDLIPSPGMSAASALPRSPCGVRVRLPAYFRGKANPRRVQFSSPGAYE